MFCSYQTIQYYWNIPTKHTSWQYLPPNPCKEQIFPRMITFGGVWQTFNKATSPQIPVLLLSSDAILMYYPNENTSWQYLPPNPPKEQIFLRMITLAVCGKSSIIMKLISSQIHVLLLSNNTILLYYLHKTSLITISAIKPVQGADLSQNDGFWQCLQVCHCRTSRPQPGVDFVAV